MTTFANEEYSDDESSEEEESQTYDPYGYQRSRGTKKERIRRRGIIPVNLTSTYGQRSGWGIRQGIRELLQNLYFTAQLC
jgi:hypothetical protein